MALSPRLLTRACGLSLGWGLGLGLVFGLGLAGCFTPPSDDVLFSCEFDGDDSCPPDYQCEADNCCHRIGSDVDAALGSCALGGNSAGTDSTGATGSDTDTDTETGTDTGTETGTDTGTDTGTETG